LREVAEPGERVLAAVSGGADSMCLALALLEIAPIQRLHVTLGVVDHGLRPGSAEEVERVLAWARARGIPAQGVRIRVARAGGLEAAARRARYLALESLAEQLDAHWIATGHTASDQAETVLLRLGRGAGARGARGVLPQRGRVLRPLLGATRAEVERFLSERGERALVEDPSNQDLGRSRNRIRHRVLPELRQALGPGADRALARFAAFARDDEAALESWAKRVGPDRAELRALPVAVLRRWLRLALEAQGYTPNAADLQLVARAVRRPGARAVELARTFVVRIGDRFVSVERKDQRPPVGAPVELRAGRAQRVPWAGLEVRIRRARPARADGALELALPPDVALPLTLRPAALGDRMAGERGTVRLNRLLIDRKVPREERPRVPVLVDGEGRVLWVLGHRVAAGLRSAQGASEGWLVQAHPLSP
jgi:tRNA(Ile)-lysidine synthase